MAHRGGLHEKVTGRGLEASPKEVKFASTLLQQLVLDNSLSQFGLQEGGEIRSRVPDKRVDGCKQFTVQA